MRERVTTDQIKLARTVDLISYMQRYEPEELIRTGPHDYKTATHSSLCISDNGLWHWYSRGIGGRGALNYLIQVKGMDFVSAVRHLCELELPAHAPFQPVKKNPQHEYAIAGDFLLCGLCDTEDGGSLCSLPPEQMSYMKQHFREPHFFIESAEGNDYFRVTPKVYDNLMGKPKKKPSREQGER